MRKTSTPAPWKPAPKRAPNSTPSRAPTRRPIVANRDNQLAQKGKPRGIRRKASTVLDMAAIELIEAARRCQDEISTMYSGFNTDRRRLIAKAYGVARGLQKNPQAWDKFREDDFWKKRTKKPSVDDRKAPLLHVMVFVFKAIDRTIYKRAAKYAAALKQYWGDKVPAQQVAAKIKKDGGIEKLYRDSAGSKSNKKVKPEQSSKLTFSATEGRRGCLLALSEGQEARLIIRRVTTERGVVARIVGFYPVKI